MNSIKNNRIKLIEVFKIIIDLKCNSFQCILNLTPTPTPTPKLIKKLNFLILNLKNNLF